MAEFTDRRLQGQLIYSIYVRAHTEEGTFLSIIPDLDRIRDLGADWIWFLPIHPIGVKGKKGSLGCPYANRDYRAVNPAYGSMEDFRTLCGEIRRRGMKVMIDVVYNHSSPDAVLLREHPEFYWRDGNGNVGNKIGDWADVIDLDYRQSGLWDYQIESLKMWAQLVDGFRCDVASFVPVAFWKRARAAVAEVNPDCVWLAALHEWTGLLNLQEALYPDNYNKLRFLENHDQPRIGARVKDERALDNYTAMLFFLKGTTLLYAGQEFSCTHRPSLFEKEVFDRSGRDISACLRKLRLVKGRLPDGAFLARADDGHAIAVMERFGPRDRWIGIFSLRGESAAVRLDVPDGEYANLAGNGRVLVENGQISCAGEPIIFTLPR